MSVTTQRQSRQAARTAQSTSAQALVAALAGEVPRVRVGIFYRLGLLLVAVAMLVLPLVYLALIALACWAVYWHATENVTFLGGPARGGRGRGMFLLLLVYLIPIVIGGVLILFMIKPLFARRRTVSVPVTIFERDQPLVHAFVNALADLVRAPRPKRIDVDSQVNASASFDEGLLGWVRRSLVLTIGLPLVAGLDLRQLAGVLAHELGHFAQGGAMRLTYIIRSVNMWFARVAYERDAWDDRLVALSRNGEHWSIQITALLAMMFVGVARLVLKGLLLVGHTISSAMLRQMEFDADRYEARVAGSDVFERTVDRLVALNLASQAAMHDLQTAWQERRLCDDLATLIKSRDDDMPAKVRADFTKMTRESKTGWFDTHPADADRIASVRREAAPGVFRADGPATVLFNDFEEVSRLATMRLYLDLLGDEVRPEHVFPTEQLISSRGRRKQGAAAMRRFFQGLLDARRPVYPAAHVMPAKDEAAAAEQILEARCEFTSSVEAARKWAKQYDEADERLYQVIAVKVLRTTEAKLDVPHPDLAKADDAALRRFQAEAQQKRADAAKNLADALVPAVRRLELALSIDAARERAKTEKPEQDDGEYAVEQTAKGSVNVLLDTIARLRSLGPTLEELRVRFHEQAALLAQIRPAEDREMLINAVLTTARRCSGLLAQIQAACRDVPYPYEHAEGRVSLARFAVPRVYTEQQVGELQGASETALEACFGLYMRVMCDLVARAEAIESDLGLPPLPEPAEEPAEEPADEPVAAATK